VDGDELSGAAGPHPSNQNPPPRILGINCDPHAAFLATIQGGAVVDGLPERLKPPEGMELGDRLLEFVDEVRRVIGQVGPSRVGLLLPESRPPSMVTSSLSSHPGSLTE